MTTTLSETEVNLCRAQNVIDKTWRRMSDTFLLRVAEGRSIEGFPDLSEIEAARTAGQARSAIVEIDAIDTETLPHQLALTVKVARFQLHIEAQAGDRHWLAQNSGSFPAMFPIGTYGAGYLFTTVLKTFTDFVFSRSGDCDRYLALIEDCAELVGQMRQRLIDQAARGIRIPQPALPGMRALVAGQANAARERLRVNPTRLGAVSAHANFADVVSRRIEERVSPAFATLLESIGHDYGARSPENVGMGQFKDGAHIYESLVAEHVSMPITIDAVHRIGHVHMERVENQMAEIRGSLGYSAREPFHRYLLTDHAWVARSASEVQARFDAAIRRVEPRIDALFHFKPAARYRTARLDPTLEAGMTNGYYQDPIVGHPDGVYYFNGSNLSEQTLATAPSLIFHELIPGHHFHFASQKENGLLHPLRQNLFFNAFNEGWAEYAATLAGELDMYAGPYERYGRLLMDAFVICRLVVDTGMNALGWPLERARAYIRKHTILSESEILSETLRYSTDIPAQGLAYKMGEIKMLELRQQARDTFGDHFDIRDFHDTVLRSGGMPLEVLDWHVNAWLRPHMRQSDHHSLAPQ
jgi:uncharacterized protein (DUF885 family)